MTDQNPSPTTRMPVPDPPVTSDAPDAPDTLVAVTPPPPPPPSEPSSPAATSPAAIAPPPAARSRRSDPDHGRTASILFGLVFLGLGLWFFAEQTLGYELPDIQWSQVWPVFLIVVGLWVVLGSTRRGSR